MDLLLSVFNHLVLPPQLPGTQDTDLEALSYEVLLRIIRACETADSLVNPPWSEAFQSLRASLSTCRTIHSGRLDKSTLLNHFRNLQPNRVLILYVAEQNAALLVRRESRDHDSYVVFEAFEASPVSEHVLAAGHALQWDFPGRSAQVPFAAFMEQPFLENLAAFLEQASMESLYTLQASTKKAQVSLVEVRDTTDPALITQMLMPLLEAMGSHFQAPTLRKRVRDEVNIQKADLPWRRLPFWLILRVAAQRQLCLILGNEKGRIGYKFLVCLILTELLKESVGKLSPALVTTLRAKLCRRMAKLEMDRAVAGSTDVEILFNRITPLIEGVIRDATTQLETAWEAFKKQTTRPVPTLPLYAPQSAIRLSLLNSGKYLSRILYNQPQRQNGASSLNLPSPADKAVQQTQDFTDHVFHLADMESRVDQDDPPSSGKGSNNEGRCIELAKRIDQIFTEVGRTYDADPEQMSAMILALFTLWIRMDKYAVKACPVLDEHRLPFDPELLDVLQLPTMSEMRRLQEIQIYLSQRQSRSKHGTIFDKLDKNCLAVRYVAQSTEMLSLGARIQSASDQARNAKENEWTKACADYDQHTAGITAGTCCCTWKDGQRVVKGCKTCWHARTRRRIKIKVHEAYLPESNPARAALIFELGIPSYLSTYRDATWKILSLLAHPSRPERTSSPVIELKKCEPLKRFMAAGAQGISLASTIKCFEQTHYKFTKGKAPLSRVLLPLAANFELYDHATELWVKDLGKPLTFQHLCGVHVPRALQATVLPTAQHPLPTVDGPSSYEIQANQVECPSDMSVHEFSAYQKLLGGKVRRWPNILVEMGSSNLNIGNEDTARVLSQLAIQAGPWLQNEPLRAAHVVFKEAIFVERLVEIIKKRLQAILTNWREHHYMGLLITLALRLFHLSSGSSRTSAEALLQIARNATLEWTVSLRKELRTTADASAAQRIAMYGFCASILCRRTFAIYAETNRAVTGKDLSSWILASVALQENLLVDITKLPQSLKSMLLRDMKMAYHLQPLLKDAIGAFPASVEEGIVRSWSDGPEKNTTSFSQWLILPQGRWIVARASEIRGKYTYTQTIHYNFIEGHMLVNGQLRGNLPLEIRESQHVKEMFGNQHILTYPSFLPGMSHRLSHRIHGQSVHFGMRDGQVVIRALSQTCLLEFVPRETFSGQKGFDLPTELTENCIHWLNLSTKSLEIRRMPAIWVKRQRDWEIDIPNRRAFRGNVNLVDSQSPTFIQVANLLQHFEHPEKLTVYQPQVGKMMVELRHLDLSFAVNNNGLLECRQLNAEIDPDQDPGTWYGLQSKIVLRDVVSHKRSVIVPLGDFMYSRHGMHVNVLIRHAQEYARYRIDDILGRLSCPPEPRLLYMKALCHAVTSFCLPDTLTGRTGTDEAFSILRSGAAQPWVPLGGAVHPILKIIESLSPRRVYYPPDKKRLQTVTWSEHLTATIQHDGFEALVREIIIRSNRLNRFGSGATKDIVMEDSNHLRTRGEMQRRLYERPTLDTASQVTRDTVYMSRDRKKSTKSGNVYEISRLILNDCPSLYMRLTLKAHLESSEVIGGFHGESSSSIGREPLISQIEEPIFERWGALVQFCRHTDHKAPLLFRLGLLAFHSNPNMDVIRSLAAFALVNKIRQLPPPLHDGFFDFKSRERPSAELLQTLISSAYSVFIPRRVRGRNELQDRAGRTAQAHQEFCALEGQRLASHLLAQWPLPVNQLSTAAVETKVIDVRSALGKIRPEWERRRENRELESYVNKVQAILGSRSGPRDSYAPVECADVKPSFTGRKNFRTIPSISQDLVVKVGPPLENPTVGLSSNSRSQAGRNRAATSPTSDLLKEGKELETILHKFSNSASVIRRQYGNDLLQSLAALKDTGQSDFQGAVPTLEDVWPAIDRARGTVTAYYERICNALAAGDVRIPWLRLGAISPCISPTELLALLRSTSVYSFGAGMKKALVSYGLAVTNLQRLKRLEISLLRDDKGARNEELRNPGHENWSPLQSPDWLLLEIDGDFLIRAEQVTVARAMITPQSGRNSVLQMNMGKGKTSCIVPMVIAVLADGKNLSRLIVPKALLMQTAQTTQSRLGGLVGRDVLHVPFSRKTPTAMDMLELYADLHRGTRKRRGLILTSHEHVLSYKLGGWQHLADGKLKAARHMSTFQKWLDDHCRDVLDESDFTLAVKTQLNYPSGPEMAVDGHPFRWQVAQELLALVAYHVPILQKRFPTSIEILWRPRSFPIIHLLKSDVEEAIHELILDSICAGRTRFLRPADSSFRSRQGIIRRVLSEPRFDERMFTQAVDAFANPQAASKILLVVRGLLINRILLLCLNKRWNVQYGLHPGRHPVAVPFEAKGTPSEQSEFGHPDVAILFTCLAFYYTGLTPEQFRQGLHNVLQSDDPAAQYESYTSGCDSLPESLRHWNVINIEDEGQLDELREHLRLSRVVIDHYMNHFVFPAHARQFEIKLQVSAWDIPLFLKDQRGVRTTGFSGTNDSRVNLPLTIQQDDLPALQHTSAEVLSYLLQPSNRNYQVTTDPSGKRLTEEDLLQRLSDSNIRTLIDAGAYILEMDNKTVAQTWLKKDHQADAAVYFGADNRAWVHYRGEKKNDVPLLATPFADDLRQCVVYLDEAHTRGVDLKLPLNAHGALTLALKQTKDYTMQAAMRLRQLRTSQSVTFFAPPEVDQSIKDFCRPARGKKLDSSDVVSWLLEQTCCVNEDLQGLYVAQGIDFCRRTDAIWSYNNFLTDNSHRAKLLETIQQPERQTLEQLYGGALAGPRISPADGITTPQLQIFAKQLYSSYEGRGYHHMGAMEEVEQEREVQVQVEQVRQVQKPIRYEPLAFPGLHPTIVQFLRTGQLENTSNGGHAGFEHAFEYMARTALGTQFGVRATNSRLFVSKEFGRTVKCHGNKIIDNYLRPVEWILWCPSTKTALVIIPEEAELLIPALRYSSPRCLVHLIAYAAPVTKAMQSFNTLKYYVLPQLPGREWLPEWFRFELGILAGRLYVDLTEWDPLAAYLGLLPESGDGPPGGSSSSKKGAGSAAFVNDPSSFLLEWLTLLRKTQDVTHTHMGYICMGRSLKGNHPFHV